MNPKVDVYINKAKKWQKELRKLRAIVLACGLTEELKWSKPCYTFEGHNVVLLLPLKNYCSLLFCKGALLRNARGLLIQPTENTQAARQIRLTNLRQIVELENILKDIIHQAVEVEKAGLEVTYKKTVDFKIPEELQNRFHKNSALKTAFNALTPGRQRAYILYFSAPKQSTTRDSRIEKCMEKIIQGKGLNDDYIRSKKRR